MSSLVCGVCSVKYEDYDDLEACLQKHLAKIKKESDDESEQPVTESFESDLVTNSATYLTAVKTEIEFDQSEEADLRFVKCEDVETHFVKSEEISEEQTSTSKASESIEENVFTEKGIRIYQCHLCPYKTNFIKYLNRHYQETHLEQEETANPKKFQFSCQNCSMRFTSYSQKINHIDQCHESNFEYRCQKCDYAVVDRDLYNQHIRKCSLSPQLKNYLEKRTNPEYNPKYVCIICAYRCVTQTHLNRHMENHTSSLYCSTCDKTFISKSRLNQHNAVVHCGRLPIRCGHCVMRFATISEMRQHATKTHSSEY